MTDYQETSKEIRKKIIKMKYESQEGHLGSALSCVDILNVLYFKAMSIDPKHPLNESRDRFILSKGHAASALYAVLAQKGFFEEKLLDTYCKNGSKLAGHCIKGSLPGVEVSSGALGHGLPMGEGIALAGKNDDKNYRVFVLMSDGECDEGTTWEAALFASHHKLDNLAVIIDYNKWQAFGRTNEVLNLEPLAEKWQAFGWSVKEIDGHNFAEIESALSAVPLEKGKPSVIIANTIKCKGIPALEDKLESHYKHLTKEDYEKSIRENSN
jgi:transketolase